MALEPGTASSRTEVSAHGVPVLTTTPRDAPRCRDLNISYSLIHNLWLRHSLVTILLFFFFICKVNNVINNVILAWVWWTNSFLLSPGNLRSISTGIYEPCCGYHRDDTTKHGSNLKPALLASHFRLINWVIATLQGLALLLKEILRFRTLFYCFI